MSATARLRWEPETASGGRTSWARTVTALAHAKGAKGFVGDYLVSGVETDLPIGLLILEVVPTGSRSSAGQEAWLWRVGVNSNGDGRLKRVPGTWNWRKEQLSLRDRVAELLAEPEAKPEPAEATPEVDLYAVRGALVVQLDLLRQALLAWPEEGARQRLGNMRELLCDGLERLSRQPDMQVAP